MSWIICLTGGSVNFRRHVCRIQSSSNSCPKKYFAFFSIIHWLIQSQIIYFGSYSNGLFIEVKCVDTVGNSPDTPLDSGQHEHRHWVIAKDSCPKKYFAFFSIIYWSIQSQIIYSGSYSMGLSIGVKCVDTVGNSPDTPLDSGQHCAWTVSLDSHKHLQTRVQKSILHFSR